MPADEAPVAAPTEAEVAALASIQRFIRKRMLRAVWYEIITDVVDWHRLYKQLQENKAKRMRAAEVLQKGVRKSPATNLAMRIANKASAPVLIRASRVMNAYARGWVWRTRLKKLRVQHIEFLAEAEHLAECHARADATFGDHPTPESGAVRGHKDRQELASAQAEFDKAATKVGKSNDEYYPETSPQSAKAKGKQRASPSHPSPPWKEDEIDEARVLKERKKRQQQEYMERLEARQAEDEAKAARMAGKGIKGAPGSSGSIFADSSSGEAGPSTEVDLKLVRPPAVVTDAEAAAETAQRKAILKMERLNPNFDLEDAILTANALHRTLMDRELPISQEGYAKAASILHRKAKTSAPRVIQGMQQLSTAFLVLQASARGYLGRRYARMAADANRKVATSAVGVLLDFFAVGLNRMRMSYGFAELISRVQASTKIASIVRGKRARASFKEMEAAHERSRALAAERIKNANLAKQQRRDGNVVMKDRAVDMLKDFLRDQARLSRNTRMIHQMREKLMPLQAAIRRRKKWKIQRQQDDAATGIGRFIRGKKGRADTEVIRARIHAQQVELRQNAIRTIEDVLIVGRNRDLISMKAMALRTAASQALLHREQLKQASAQVVVAKHVRRRMALRRVGLLRILRESEAREAAAKSVAAGEAGDELFAPLHRNEYYGYAPPAPLSGVVSPSSGSSPVGSPNGGGRPTGADFGRGPLLRADALPPSPFETFDECLTVEQLGTLDALSGMGVGFMRSESAVRGGHGLAFYCYRGRATPAQFPHLPPPGKYGYDSMSAGISAAAAQLEMECRLRHEMRGIAVHRPTRRLLCRPYHKFWHIGSRPEQLAQEVAELAAAPALPLVEKLDGVMVQGFMVDGRVYLATRSGRSNAAVEAESLLRGEEGQRWIRLCAVCGDAGYTPLFEFTSPNLSSAHREPALTLAACRHMRSGLYLPYSRLATIASRFQVPVVPLLGTWSPPAPPPRGWASPNASADELAHELQLLVDSIRGAMQHTASQRPLEGCVLTLPSGLTLKLKTRAHLQANGGGGPHSPNAMLASPQQWSAGGRSSPLPSSLVPTAPPWSPPLQFGPLSPPAAVVADAPLAEAVHLLLACASDAASSPNATSLRVGHWAHRPSQKRLTHAATKILHAAERARRYPDDEPAYAKAEQVLADALALTLHVAQSHGAPTLSTGGYPVQQIHALLAEEGGLLLAEAARSTALVPGLRQTQSWPVDLLGCAGRTRPTPERPMLAPPPSSNNKYGAPPPRRPSRSAAPEYGFGTPSAPVPPSGGGGAFGTPLLSGLFASLSGSGKPSAADGFGDEWGGRRGGRRRR